ncbi:DUF1570 domain-containing protein [bacterium]|nr:DUF1570 domain-containing protein [bacterium]
MKTPDNPFHRSLWRRAAWMVLPAILWMAFAAGGAERSAAAPAVLAAPTAVVADVLRPKVYFDSAPQIHLTRHFELVNGRGNAWTDRMGDTLEDLYGAFRRDMAELGFALSDPAEPLIWLCFDNEKAFSEYARVADSFNPDWLREYYSPRTNRVAMLGAGAMARTVADTDGEPIDILPISHESAHQFSYSTGLFKRGVMYPVWLTEGIAMSFETDSAASMGLNKFNLPRMRQLLKARREGRMLPLAQLITMTRFRPDEGHDIGDLYAQADGFFAYMLLSRTQAMRGYIARLGSMPPGRRSASQLAGEFTAAFGPLGKLEAAWNAHLESVEQTLELREKMSPANPLPGLAGLVTPVVNH